MKTSKYCFIIFRCGACVLPLPLPLSNEASKMTFLCSINVGELNYSRCMVEGVRATLQGGNLSLHFKCDSSLHRHLLSLLFLFNNLITSSDLFFFPKWVCKGSCQWIFIPCLRTGCLFLKAGAAQQLAQRSQSASWGNWERGKAHASGQEEGGSQSTVHCSYNLPFLCLMLCSHSVREAEKPLSAAAKNCAIGVVLVGKKFLWVMQTVLHSSFHRSCGPTLGHYLKSLLWPNVSITFTLLVADQIGSQLWNFRPGETP